MEFRTRDGVAKAINGTSFTLSERETLAILGESGSGKSVTAQALWASSSPLQPRSLAGGLSTAG
ncbi:oligopeptide transport ATP-binding protein OppD [Cutibacterium acnes JCM 18909]|nr:oligopeptide transport ATP-binding protein OppD [Cutibacterium acnes JCM 18909]